MREWLAAALKTYATLGGFEWVWTVPAGSCAVVSGVVFSPQFTGSMSCCRRLQ